MLLPKRGEVSFCQFDKKVLNQLNVQVGHLKIGKKLFIDNCATCHKDHGGGDSGPNLTDEFWIHGGGIKNIFLKKLIYKP